MALADEGARAIPCDAEAELSVLGSLLLDNDMIGPVSEILRPAHFHRPAHRTIYETMVDLYDRHHAVDAVSLKNRLSTAGRLEDVGGAAVLVKIMETVPSAANAVTYASIVRDHAVRRELLRIAQEIAHEVTQTGEEAGRVLELTEQRIFEIAEHAGLKEARPIRDLLPGVIRHLETIQASGGAPTGLPTGFYELDRMTSGLQPGELVIIAARPSMGKTTFALNLARRQAIGGTPTAFFSLEMNSRQVSMNMLCGHAGVAAHKIRSERLADAEWDRLWDAMDRLNAAPLFVDDTGGLTITALRAKARRLRRHQRIGCVYVDYLQLMDSADGDSRQEQISRISRGLKAIARELEIPVVALSQLNRSVDSRDNHRPRMSDLRESGAIEQDADVIMFLYREDYYAGTEGGEAARRRTDGHKAEIIIAKQRNGPTGAVELLFFPESFRFENPALAS